jgi:hypothetical protein
MRLAKHPKLPRDPNQLGKLIVDLPVGETTDRRAEIARKAAKIGAARVGPSLTS